MSFKDRPAPHSSLLGAALCIASPLFFAALTLFLGREAGWDLLNYHWYNPFAFLNDRFAFDIAVGHHATYYNPIADIPFYLIAKNAPAWVAGMYLGAMFGVAVALIGAIAYQLLEIANPYARLTVAAALAVAGTLGGGAQPAIGNTSNDVLAAIGAFAAVWIILKSIDTLQSPETDRGLALKLFFAGLLAGSSVGLKLTIMTYAIALAAAVFFCSRRLRRRFLNTAFFGAGLAGGFLLCGGYWMWRMWEYSRNPLFPYFNQFFQSPLLLEGSYRDTGFIPGTWLTTWFFPFYFTFDSHYVAEWSFRDAHVLAAYVLVPVAAALMLFKRANRDGPVSSRKVIFLFVFSAASYLIWLRLFSIYRYLIPLEMLTPLLIAAAVLLWPVRLRTRVVVIVSVLAIAQWLVKLPVFRLSWDREYVSVQLPKVVDPRRAMVLFAGVSPMSFVIPSFPREIPFLRVDGWLINGNDASSGFAREMHARVAAHRGPLYMMFYWDEDHRALKSAKNYSLTFSAEPCQLLRSNVAEPLKFCRLGKKRDEGTD